MTFVNYCAYCGAATVGSLDEFGRCKCCVAWERAQGWKRGGGGELRNDDDDPLDDEPAEESSS